MDVLNCPTARDLFSFTSPNNVICFQLELQFKISPSWVYFYGDSHHRTYITSVWLIECPSDEFTLNESSRRLAWCPKCFSFTFHSPIKQDSLHFGNEIRNAFSALHNSCTCASHRDSHLFIFAFVDVGESFLPKLSACGGKFSIFFFPFTICLAICNMAGTEFFGWVRWDQHADDLCVSRRSNSPNQLTGLKRRPTKKTFWSPRSSTAEQILFRFCLTFFALVVSATCGIFQKGKKNFFTGQEVLHVIRGTLEVPLPFVRTVHLTEYLFRAADSITSLDDYRETEWRQTLSFSLLNACDGEARWKITKHLMLYISFIG